MLLQRRPGPLAVAANGGPAASGDPGSYLAIERDWETGDAVAFDLPIGLRLARYHGADCFTWHIRCALLYGPLLLAVVGPPGDPIPIALAQDPADFPQWLIPVKGQRLRWRIAGHPEHLVMPYWEVDRGRHFSCYPVLEGKP
jgi:hypothetical protein